MHAAAPSANSDTRKIAKRISCGFVAIPYLKRSPLVRQVMAVSPREFDYPSYFRFAAAA
jgi:hypothetical protein